MRHALRTTTVAAAIAALLAAPLANATNGYFKIGYGSKNRGMGGAGVAYAQDSMVGVVNPAGIAFVGNEVNVGLELFNPQRRGRVDARMMGGADTGEVDSGATIFAIPHAGFSMRMGSDMVAGFTMAANGGMNTRYNSNLFTDAFSPAIGATSTLGGPSGFAGGLEGAGIPTSVIDPVLMGFGQNPNLTPSLGVNLGQLIMSPTVSYKLNRNHAVGASLQVAYQQFRAYGLGLFQGFSSDPAHVTNQGNDHSWGAGVRVGYSGKLTDRLMVGASAASKIYMDEFDDYAGLFAEQGDFDIPANIALGLAFEVTPKTTVAFDVQRIFYGDVDSIANPGPTAQEFFGSFAGVLSGGLAGQVTRPLGTDNGFGFGWDDITVYKLGVNYEHNDHWTFRGGLNYAENPISDEENLFNVIAPGVVETHLTLGFSYAPTRNSEWTVTYMRAFDKEQSYTYTAPNPLDGGATNLSYTAEIGMYQNALEFSYAYKF